MNGMIGPVGLAAGVGVLVLACAAASIIRIVGARVTSTATDWSVDGCHAVMGVSMAGMLIPSLGIVRPGASTWVWVVVSALIAAWFAISVVRDVAARTTDRIGRIRRLHHLPHLILSGAMVYMLAALGATAPGGTTTGDMGAMGGGAGGLPLPTLDIALSVFMVGYAVVLIDRLPALAGARETAGPAAGAAAVLLAPRAAAALSVAMATGMAYMLVMMFA